MDIKDIASILFESAAEGLVVADKQGTILIVNNRLEEIFGYKRNELIGEKVEKLIPERLKKGHAHKREKYTHHPSKRSMGIGLDLYGKRKDGTVVPVEISLNHSQINGEIVVMALISDVTLRKKAEDEKHQLHLELEQRVKDRTEELEKAQENIKKALTKERELNEMKSRFVSMASHEFRTPLTSILTSSSILEKYIEIGGSKEKTLKHLNRINNSVLHLTNILNDFLSLERVEQGKIQLNPSAIEVDTFVKEVVEDILLMVKEGQSINHIHKGESTFVFDKGILKNILNNLLSNARKYSPKDSKILLNTSLKNKILEVEIIDNGQGIPKEEQEYLFERFFRAKNAANIEGTGLGLSIVKKYLDFVGGEINFESELEKGTTFILKIPNLKDKNNNV
ncbi:MAG: PAS domain-containing sensor histidine kinase [Chitinophagales bacterium]